MNKERILDITFIIIFNVIASRSLLFNHTDGLISIVLTSVACIIATAIFIGGYTKAKKKIEANPESKTRIGLSFANKTTLSAAMVYWIFMLIGLLYSIIK